MEHTEGEGLTNSSKFRRRLIASPQCEHISRMAFKLRHAAQAVLHNFRGVRVKAK